jgi:hypothetical protein
VTCKYWVYYNISDEDKFTAFYVADYNKVFLKWLVLDLCKVNGTIKYKKYVSITQPVILFCNKINLYYQISCKARIVL